MYVSSSSMAPYVEGRRDPPVIMDFLDVDSDKWTQYARRSRGPLRWLYGREGARLRAVRGQRGDLGGAAASLTTRAEAELLRSFAPWARTAVIPNGIDLDEFAPVGGARPGTGHGVHRRHGLPAQRRCRHALLRGHSAVDPPGGAGGQLPHRRIEPVAGRRRLGRLPGRDRDRRRPRCSTLLCAGGGGGGAPPDRARRPEQGPPGDGHGRAGGCQQSRRPGPRGAPRGGPGDRGRSPAVRGAHGGAAAGSRGAAPPRPARPRLRGGPSRSWERGLGQLDQVIEAVRAEALGTADVGLAP